MPARRSSRLSFDILRNRDFRLLALTRLMGAMALQAQAVIVGWQIYSLTKSTLLLGLTGLVEALPALSCALVAGHIVDISRPYLVFVSCYGMLALNILALLLIAGGVVPAPGGNVVPWIYAGVFFSGLTRSFMIPSSFSLQPQIIPREHLSAASAWMTSGFQIGIITGPAMAGLIYGGYGVRAAWMLPVGLVSAAFMLACALGRPHRHFRPSQKREPVLRSIRAGWGFILKSRVLFAAMALDMFAVLFGGAVAMLPAYADRVLHVGSEGLGALRAAPALGAVIVTLLLAVRPLKRVHATLLLWMVAGFGISIIGFGLSTVFSLSILCLILSGAFDSVSMVIRQTLVQWLTPDEMRGRVASVNSMFIISSNEIGAFESGVAAHFLGLVPSVAFGGTMTLLIVALMAVINPKLRRTVVDAEPI